MNTEIIDAGRDISGGYKVDVSRGENVDRVSSEWFSRPDDERYLSLDDLFASVKGRAERSRTRMVESAAAEHRERRRRVIADTRRCAKSMLHSITNGRSLMFKAMYFVKRKPGMRYEDYAKHQMEVHAPLAHRLPGMRRYHVDLLRPIDGQDQPFDAIVSVWYDSADAQDAAMASPEGQEAVADIPLLADPDEMVMVLAETVMDKTDFPQG